MTLPLTNPHRLAQRLRRRATLLDRLAWAIENRPVSQTQDSIAKLRSLAKTLRAEADVIKPKAKRSKQ